MTIMTITPSFRRQRGVVLIVALILLLVLTLIGVGVTQSTSLEERMAGNARDKDLAFQAAEAGLRNGEDNLLQGLYTDFNSNGTGGLYIYNAATPTIWTGTVNWSDTTAGDNDSAILYSGAQLTFSTTSSSATNMPYPPVFVVEQMPPAPLPGSAASLQQYVNGLNVQMYRITAVGTGGDANSQAMLQSVFNP